MVIAGLTRLLEMEDSIRVVGSAATLSEGLSLCERQQPDAVILDLRLPDSKGAQEVARVRRQLPESKIVVLTGFGDAAREEAMAYGADAFLTKELASEAITQTLRRLCPDPIGIRNRSDLTPRERDVARLVAKGMTNMEVADSLSLSLNTVKTHLKSILSKLGYRDRVELALRYRD